MNIAGLFFLIITQFLTGRGILGIFNVKLKPFVIFFVAEMIGVAVFSLVPMFIDLAHIPITTTSVFISLCITTALLAIIPFKRYDFSIFKSGNIKWQSPKIYEWMMIVLLVLLMVPSIWRCYLYPPNPRDILSGPEALAEYTLKEHTLNNSVFTVNLLESTPNLLKPPYITDLQIIYRMFAHPFGTTWLSIIVICFLVWLYNILRERLHPVLAGFCVMVFMSVPEMYGYTYLMLWDYSNMVFFFAGYYFLLQYFDTKKQNIFLFSCLMFGLATFIRLDTLLFVALTGLLFIYVLWKDKVKPAKIAVNVMLLGIIPFLFYFIWAEIFVKYYLPLELSAVSELNLNPEHGYGDWFSTVNKQLFFGGINYALYGTFIYLFIGVLLIDAIFFRKHFSRETRISLIGVFIVYLGLPAMVYATAWFNITTAKRGIFKAFALIMLYYGSSPMIQRFSQAIISYEYPKAAQKKVKATPAAPKQQGNKHKKKKGKK